MGLIRRNKSVPVQVQRREGTGEEEVVDIPPGVRIPSTQASGQPHVTQNNIYISTPAQAAMPPPAPPPATEIHHHTTVHHISRVMERRRGLSFFGVAGGGVGVGGDLCSVGGDVRSAIGACRVGERGVWVAGGDFVRTVGQGGAGPGIAGGGGDVVL